MCRLALSPHLLLCLPSYLFLQVLPPKRCTQYVPPTSVCFILTALITDENYVSWSSSLCNFFQSLLSEPLTFKYLLSALPSKALILRPPPQCYRPRCTTLSCNVTANFNVHSSSSLLPGSTPITTPKLILSLHNTVLKRLKMNKVIQKRHCVKDPPHVSLRRAVHLACIEECVVEALFSAFWRTNSRKFSLVQDTIVHLRQNNRNCSIINRVYNHSLSNIWATSFSLLQTENVCLIDLYMVLCMTIYIYIYNYRTMGFSYFSHWITEKGCTVSWFSEP